MQTLSGGRYGFKDPDAIAVDGTHIWVANGGVPANGGGGSVTELNASDGSWVQTLSGGSYGFYSPDAIAVDGTHVWVANDNGDANDSSVTEFPAG